MKMVDNMLEFFGGFKSMKNEIDQQICGKFVDKHIYCSVNWMTEYILSKDDRDAPFTWDDISNFWTFPEYCGKKRNFDGGSVQDKLDRLDELNEELEELDNQISDMENEIEEYKDQLDDDEAEGIVLRSKEIRANINDLECELEELLELRSDIEDDITEIEYMDSEPAEIFEWWIVSSFLVDKLKRMGHPVLEQENIWGRCTSGQAIYMDYAIRQIAENMEILCGQRYQWTV
jgi:hypothetical protein